MTYGNGNNHLKAYVSKEPAYGGVTNYPNHMQRPKMFDKDGGQYAIVGRFAAHNWQSYLFATQEVVKFGSGDDRKHSPPRKDVFTNHGAAGSSTEKANSLSPKLNHPGIYSPTKGLPGPDSFLKDKSPSPRNHQYFNTNDYGKHSHLSSNDDKNDEDDLSHNYKMNEKSKELSYDIENNKRYPPANYKITYHDKASYDDNNEKHNGHNDEYVPPKVKNIPQIKTRIMDPEFAKANMKKPVNFASPQRGQGYQKVIDSSEARRRYSGGPSTRAAQYVEEKYDGIIDSREAARKYDGVFVPN